MNFIYGLHAVKAALLSHHFLIQNLYITSNRKDIRIEELISLAQQTGVNIQRVSQHQLREMIPVQYHHQGVFASCEKLPIFNEDDLAIFCQDLPDNALFLLLDGIQDPHNLGACLRTANVMSTLAVIAPKDRAASLTPAAIKVASGAAAITPFVQVTNLSRIINYLQEQGVWIYGADMSAKELLWEADLNRKLGLVVGNEGSGLRQLTRKHCDQLIKIPQYGEVDSLNVSVATGICLYEIRRQQAIK